MKMSNKKIKKLIYKDCRKAMTPSAILYAIEECISGLVMIYAAGILGSFSDAVFNFDLSFGIDSILKLLICIVSMVFIIPLIGIASESTMFINALKHDRIIFNRFFNKEYEEAMKIEQGEAQYCLENNPIEFRYNWSEMVTKSIMTPIAFIYLMINAVQISWVFTLIVFIISSIKLIVPIAVKNLEAKYDQQIHEYNVSVRSYESELVEKPHVIKMYGLKKAFLDILDKVYDKHFEDVEVKSIKYKSISQNITSFLDTFCIILILLIGAVMVASSSITPGAVVAMVGYFSVFNLIISNVDFLIRNIPILKNSADRMMIIYEDMENLSGEELEVISNVSAENLSFSYDEKEVFNNVNFNINIGDKTSICGHNGSGKSTLIKVVCGLLKGYRGSLKVNNKEVENISSLSLQKHIAYAEQSPYLFSGTVLENVRIGNYSTSEENVYKIMDYIGITHLASREVSMDQNNLSGGEKQKISIARAVLKNAPIIILDEPNNNLDNESLIWLDNFIKTTEKTVLFVSHNDNLSSISKSKIVL